MSSSSSIISRVEEFFYYQEDLCEKIEKWAKSRCETFLPDPRSNEQPLHHTKLYEEYCELFEKIIENFLSAEVGFNNNCRLNMIYFYNFYILIFRV